MEARRPDTNYELLFQRAIVYGKDGKFWHVWQHGICNLKIGLGADGFESHPLRQPISCSFN